MKVQDEGMDVVAVPVSPCVLPRGTIPSWGWDSSVPAGPELTGRTQRQKWGPGEQRAALTVRTRSFDPCALTGRGVWWLLHSRCAHRS